MLDTLIGDYPMRIIRTSRLTGNTTHWDMPITQAQMDAWVDGELIQNALSSYKMPFIISPLFLAHSSYLGE